MFCHCCDAEVCLARKVKLRQHVNWEPSTRDVAHWTNQEHTAYKAYQEHWTYRWGVICQACYLRLDNNSGAAEIGGKVFNIAGASRGDKASTINEAKYLAFQKREAKKMGIEL